MTVTTFFEHSLAESRTPSIAEIMRDESAETLLSQSRTTGSTAFANDQHDVEILTITIESPTRYQSVVTDSKPRANVVRIVARSLFKALLDESTSVVPIFMRYFAIHECIVLLCGALYRLHQDIGALFLSIVPGLVIIGLLSHFLLTQFDVDKVRSTFHSCKHYLVAFAVFLSGGLSIYFIYHTNTYLSSLLPKRTVKDPHGVYPHGVHLWISNILKFPHQHSMIKVDAETERPFDYRMCFVGSIIAPIIEETFKYGLVCLTLPVPFLWRFFKHQVAVTGKHCKKQLLLSERSKSSNMAFGSYSEYCIESLFIMFIAMCGGCGIAVMENIGYLAACQWPSTIAYCLPNKNQDILGAGLARGIFSVPFHCVTAGIMADVLCTWMNAQRIAFFQRSRMHLALKVAVSYPIAIAIPTLLHSNFNYWMKGWPFVTGFITLSGFTILVTRIGHRFWIINNGGNKVNISHAGAEPLCERKEERT